ncbi:hypothetical protein DFH09DRAFT_1094220 [Mycena vulgaris]|nr:hypothetical protein DFH09DRAFT_1094220 [Mycena vulgaris]
MFGNFTRLEAWQTTNTDHPLFSCSVDSEALGYGRGPGNQTVPPESEEIPTVQFHTGGQIRNRRNCTAAPHDGGNRDNRWTAIRSRTYWSFASDWCRALIDAPPATELLAMFRRLFLNSFWTQPSELNRDGLIRWLKNFGDEADPLVAALETHEPPEGDWYRMGPTGNGDAFDSYSYFGRTQRNSRSA